ncbi:MAG: hypothetical protein HC831_19670 [Chloroflexia bacterium]|nr:hypothetical protein [Chloroflexia bacterium]
MVSPMIPIIIDGDFKGLAGVDLSLEKIQQIVPQINPFEGSKALLIAPNNVIVAHTKSRICKQKCIGSL